MTDPKPQMGALLRALRERAKELNCLYGVEEILNEPDIEPAEACRRIIGVIPPGWQYPDICVARISLGGDVHTSPEFVETRWVQNADIRTQSGLVGRISVFYTEEMPDEDEGPFLKEEARLIRTIADRLGHYLQHFDMRRNMQALEAAREGFAAPGPGDWRVVLDLLSRTDKNLFQKISQKLLYYLCWSGVREAENLLQRPDVRGIADEDLLDPNRPRSASPRPLPADLGEETFRIAARHLSNEALLTLLQKWVREDRLSFLVSAVERNLPLPEIADAVRRYHHLEAQEGSISQPANAHIRVALIRRFLSEQLDYIRTAKEHFDIEDFYELIPRIISAPESHGRLGGKSAGLLLAAKILRRERARVTALGEIETPRTWHITSDMHVRFMHFNNLDEVAEQKYKDISQIRFEYPHIIHTCKNSRFPPELVNGLSVALDDLGEVPLIVRSSSVLEDRVGAAFSGKYKSLFVGNQGTKRERMDALLDAIAEVYASMFGPDPIQYRSERGLLDFSEEMGIIIQEVVGRRAGRYFFPLFAGVALSHNEFRWSPRIRREDGIIRMVPGLGTRAVDRVGDDFPVMFAPGQPNLRVNVTPDEVLRYAPRWMDVIDLESNSFRTMPVFDLIEEVGEQARGLHRLVSVYEDGRLRRPTLMDTDLDPDSVVLTFEGQLADREFVEQMRAVLQVLEEKMGRPVDVEFAHDGERLYLLQCRSQGGAEESIPAPIPKDVPAGRLIFSASRYVSNGFVPDISHIVYVDPDRYAKLASHSDLTDVGRAVGELNKLLPKRQFVLMGPGRWGSRGDIKLGVNVTYADINNTAVLIEIARKTGNYTPDLSFGTHFFQDLVEARIRYLPLYPDDEGSVLNERFLLGGQNLLSEMLPQFAHLSDTLRVIDVTKASEGRVLRIFMNADLDEAVGILGSAGKEDVGAFSPPVSSAAPSPDDSLWRLRMAEQIAKNIDAPRYGVKAMYVFGSAKNFTAGPASDIDLLVRFGGTEEQQCMLTEWLGGWSRCLDEVNYLRTGYRSGGILDVHVITDEDVENRTSYAVKIGAVTDAARPLPLGKGDGS